MLASPAKLFRAQTSWLLCWACWGCNSKCCRSQTCLEAPLLTATAHLHVKPILHRQSHQYFSRRDSGYRGTALGFAWQIECAAFNNQEETQVRSRMDLAFETACKSLRVVCRGANKPIVPSHKACSLSWKRDKGSIASICGIVSSLTIVIPCWAIWTTR